MPSVAQLRIAALGLVFASGCMALPAHAADATQVTFQPNTPWVQKVDTVSRQDSSHDYSVAIAADKTFQVNLVTRDPNVFFTIKNETQGKQLVDTYKTGATTWSIKTSAPTTFLVHVYVIPEAMQRGETPKYALQIGQYGAADMQAATTAVDFENKPWAQATGKLDSGATQHDYTVAIAAGETLKVNLIAQNPGVHFKVQQQGQSTDLVDTKSTGANTWSTVAPAATTYVIAVYADPAVVPPGKDVGYAVQIGHYATNEPATGTTAATPAAATSSPH
ncbi:MAG TPA: hypothetical protein VF284_04160 [Rhodanobacteraceae bacterium]